MKPSRPVTKPLARPLIVKLQGSVKGTARVRRLGNTQTAVSIQLAHAAAKGVTAELDKGSCGAPKGLQLEKPLGPVRGANGNWSVVAPLTKLTAAPLAVVIRRSGTVVGCGNVRAG